MFGAGCHRVWRDSNKEKYLKRQTVTFDIRERKSPRIVKLEMPQGNNRTRGAGDMIQLWGPPVDPWTPRLDRGLRPQ